MSHNRKFSRRHALQTFSAGTAASLLPVLSDTHASADISHVTKPPHRQPHAKHVIVLYMSGGFSHVDTFDPKPRLTRDHDKPIGSPANAAPQQVKHERYLKASNWNFRPNQECGTAVSDLFPHIRNVMHEAALIRSLHSDPR